MTLGERLDRASHDWIEGVALILPAVLLASLALGATYLVLMLILPAFGVEEWQAALWAGGSGLIWYPLAAGAVSRSYRERGTLDREPVEDRASL